MGENRKSLGGLRVARFRARVSNLPRRRTRPPDISETPEPARREDNGDAGSASRFPRGALLQ